MDKAYRLEIFTPKNIPKQIYQVKITLKDIHPPIWRRVLVSNYLTFADLHQIIQECFYWSDYHLHEFSYRYPDPPHWHIAMKGVYPDEPYPPDQEIEEMYEIGEDELRLCDVFSEKLKKVHYTYDFGDSWDHEIRLEKVFPDPEHKFRSFLCVAGKRATPPEDCGGAYGYQQLLEVLKNPGHPDYEDMNAWVEEDFDPETIRCPISKMSPNAIEKTYGPSLNSK